MRKSNKVVEVNLILEELDELWSLFVQCRSVFPALTTKMLGERMFTTADYYLKQGYRAQIQLQNPIDSEFIERNRRMGKWINENAIIRLWGIMNHHGLFPKDKSIDQNACGWKEVDLMRRMRNAFTKTHLNYKPSNEDNIKLRKEVIRYFNLTDADWPEGEIPTPINSVVEPIFEGCRKYIKYTTH